MMDFMVLIAVLIAIWWVVGVIVFAYLIPIYVTPKTPLGVKLTTVLISGFIVPWMVLKTGRLPNYGMITPNEIDDLERERIKRWRYANCPCKRCKQRRGEA